MADSVSLSDPPAGTRARCGRGLSAGVVGAAPVAPVLAPLVAASVIALVLVVVRGAERRETPAVLDAMATIAGSVGRWRPGRAMGPWPARDRGAALSSGRGSG